MSYDLAVFSAKHRLSATEAGDLLTALCESKVQPPAEDPRIEAFYRAITKKHPEIDDVPEDKIGDFEFSPWSCSFDRSPGHLVMCAVWPKSTYVHDLVHQLARKHQVAVYDPQVSYMFYPQDEKKWWQFWKEDR